MKRIGFLVLLSAVMFVVARPSAMIPDEVRVETGALKGVVGTTQPSVRVFKGIPYAAPPTGDLRWKAPQPPAPAMDEEEEPVTPKKQAPRIEMPHDVASSPVFGTDEIESPHVPTTAEPAPSQPQEFAVQQEPAPPNALPRYRCPSGVICWSSSPPRNRFAASVAQT